MLSGMKTKTQELKEQINRLRTEVDPKFQPEMSAVADSLEAMLDGASKGGTVRAKRLTKKRRKEIATKAANARWGKGKSVRRVEILNNLNEGDGNGKNQGMDGF